MLLVMTLYFAEITQEVHLVDLQCSSMHGNIVWGGRTVLATAPGLMLAHKGLNNLRLGGILLNKT
jgi:hypothetical protein